MAFHSWWIYVSFLTLLCSLFSSSTFIQQQAKYKFHDESPLHLHPMSPPERLTRTKRQAYQVYLGTEVSVSVDQNAGDSGPWGEWTKERECSRTCGGGVYVERRICGGSCTGPSIRYISCNVESCSADSKDFRAEQCSSHNDEALNGQYFKWVPYIGKNKCELTCRPEDSNFYYKFAEKVVDGTRCDPHGDDICVDGICLQVGCDGKLGSNAKKDKCGICNGDGSECKTVEGLFDERSLSPGYHDIVTLPVGATSIHVEELRPTSNVFAIKNATGQFLLNGNYQIQVLDKNIMAGGTAFKYEKGEGGTEKLTSNGPLQEVVTISLLLQKVAKNSAVKYEFSVPLEKDVKFLWKPGEWSGCSVTCGKGIRTRTLYCTEFASNSRVDDTYCEEQNETNSSENAGHAKPEFEKVCKTVDCEPEWFVGNWEPCSTTCGEKGVQFRVVYCHRVFSDGRRMTVPDGNCTERGLERPTLSQSCSRWSCPEWQAGPWSACSSQCGDAKQFRSVTCRSAKEGEEGKLLPADACGMQQTLEAERDCNLGPCEGLRFQTTDWELCQRCNDTEEHRNVTCRDKNGREYPLEKCLDEKSGEKKIPDDTRPCASVAPCNYEWHTSQWSKCSTECGHGHKSRKVFCAINELSQTKRVDESLCGGDRPDEREECVNEERCTGAYFTGPWSECSAQCAGGRQSRAVVCLNYDKKPVPEWCDEKEKPAEEQDCNTDPCAVCSESEFGCCPDNTTFATGPYLAGCSNCSISEFGCCSDNITEKAGPEGQECPDYVEPAKTRSVQEMEPEGSGEEPMEEKPAEMCEIENSETGEKLQIPCTTIAPSPAVEQLVELEAVEEGADGENRTKHCSKTEFGCCQDWYTPAEGPNMAGCPHFVLGSCNETKYGCCPDNVTLARGSDFEGCGEPTCAASLYGCCKDRRTIAFGPHYSGCERSSFPCELSQFGCCSDGITAALGPNGTGCGANCLLTKFGCCPNGVSQAKGPNNEGCGCEYSQYGCCPNGKDSAKGPGFYGCPDTCAQSKFGCCPDGQTTARGPNREGCPCQYTRWGCCEDGETTALGPLNEGCDDCRYAKYGCCPDGVSKAFGPEYSGCPTTTPAPYVVGGTVSPSSIVACSQPQDQGQICAPGYKLVWFYDMTEGRCSQFWHGGCGGNDNRFGSKEQCEQICVEPPGIGRCYLPKVEGPQRCTQLSARYWYDYVSKQCTAFWHRGCLGNSNNFETWEECQNFCSAADASQVHPNIMRYTGPYSAPAQQPQPHPQRTVDILPAAAVQEEMKTREVCNLRPDQGKCEGHFESWYYELATGQCERFTYSGCGGNANRFNTQEDCQALCLRRHDYPPSMRVGVSSGVSAFAPQDQEAPAPIIDQLSKAHLMAICEAPKVTGSCKQFSTKWFYNKMDGTCNRFHYGGCEGNANRFDTEQECRNTCGEYRDSCLLPKVIGPCAVKIERFYFDVHTKQCLPFQYSGCLGNNNNFRSIEDCRARCQIHTNPSMLGLRLPRRILMEEGDLTSHPPIEGGQPRNELGEIIEIENDDEEEEEMMDLVVPREGLLFGQLPELCLLPEEGGSCFGEQLRFRFDAVSGDCVGFFYSGCGQNANNFFSYESCARACGFWKNVPVCELAVSNGIGSRECGGIGKTENQKLPAVVPKWHFNASNGRCNLFLWAGCGGNGNRFQSKSECENLCRREIQVRNWQHNSTDICQMPMDAGPCEDLVTMWYFDSGQQHCRKFTFGGCRGNANRFVSKEDCESQCIGHISQQMNQTANLTTSPAGISHHILSSPTVEIPQRPRIFAFPPGTLLAGPRSNITLKCTVSLPHGRGPKEEESANITREHTFTWFKNNRELSVPSRSELQQQSQDQHIFETFSKQNDGQQIVGELQIIHPGTEDGGWYACSWGGQKLPLISEPINVRILEIDTFSMAECTEDRGSSEICKNVLQFGLCSTLRYGKFCCSTCGQH